MPISPDKFPIPTTGQPIPKGWFGRLVRFMNSLILSGDESNLLVKHTDAGTTIALAPALLQKLNQAGAPGASGSSGGSSFAFPDFSTGIQIDWSTEHQNTSGNAWIGGTVKINPNGTGSGGHVYLTYSTAPSASSVFQVALLEFYGSNTEVHTGFLYPLPNNMYYRFNRYGSIQIDAWLYRSLS